MEGTRLDILKLDLTSHVEQKQKKQHDSSMPYTYSAGDGVYCRGFGTGPKWIPVVIEEPTGPVSYLVRLENNRIMRRHQDHVRKRLSTLACDFGK